MGVYTTAVAYEHGNDNTVIKGTTATVSGAIADQFTLPTGFGECLLLECGVYITGLTPLAAPLATSGVTFILGNVVDSTIFDLIGGDRWAWAGAELSATPRFDNAILWKPPFGVFIAYGIVESAGSYNRHFIARVRRLNS